MEGSSRIYSTPIREEPIWVARRMRWLSPPDRVPACRVRVRYWSPTDFKKPSRERISFKIWSAIMAWVSVRVMVSRKARASSTGFWQNWWMELPPTVTARASRLSRFPWHSGQGHSLMHSSISRFMASDWVSR